MYVHSESFVGMHGHSAKQPSRVVHTGCNVPLSVYMYTIYMYIPFMVNEFTSPMQLKLQLFYSTWSYWNFYSAAWSPGAHVLPYNYV